jgi:Short C-terminal domain
MPLMRRRPLLRAAAIGGGAYMAGKHTMATQEREADQQARLSDLEAQQQPVAPAPVAAAAAGPDPIEQLTQLGKLREQGVLTDDEFAAQKAKVLAG